MALAKPAASPVDRGWAWVICGAGSFLHILVIGNVRSTGLLLASVSEHYNRSKRDTSWILSFMFLVFLILTPVTMALARRFSVRLVVSIGSCFLSLGFSLSYFAESLEVLYFTIGLLVGIGLSMTHPPTVLIISYYFLQRRTVAMGITFSGCSMGALCMPPLMNYLIEQYTFRGCMLIWGAIMLNVAVAAAVMRPADNILFVSGSAKSAAGRSCRRRATSTNATSAEAAEDASRGAPAPHAPAIFLASCGDVSVLFDSGGGPANTPEDVFQGNFVARLRRSFKESGRLMRRPRFWVLLFSLSLAAQAMPFNFMVLPQHGKNIGMTATEYTRLLQYQGITDLVTRISIGFLADRQLFRRQLLLLTLTIAQGALWCLLLHPTPAAALAYALLEGLLAGGLVPNLAPMLVETFGIENLGLTYGMLGIIESIIMLIVPVLLGDLFDRTGSWNASIIFLSALIGFAGLLLLADDLVQQRLERRRRQQSAKPAP
uniref:MFS domain-containing protein n=1 Tax=Macrostomum lignano TaxID=282301 RepID=A0A1I8IFU1_9PLAT